MQQEEKDRLPGHAPCSGHKYIPKHRTSASRVPVPQQEPDQPQPSPSIFHRQPPRRRDAGYVPRCLDFQVGESSGPSRASPSLIIPAVIISLDSRQLGGKTPPLSAARQLCAGGRGQGCARGAACPCPRLEREGARRAAPCRHHGSCQPQIWLWSGSCRRWWIWAQDEITPKQTLLSCKAQALTVQIFPPFSPKSNSYVIHKGPSLSAEQGSGLMPQIQCTILFFFPLFPLHVCFFCRPR